MTSYSQFKSFILETQLSTWILRITMIDWCRSIQYWYCKHFIWGFPEVSACAIHQYIQADVYGRCKQIKFLQRQHVRDSLSAFSRFVPKETDRGVHLQDITMACMPTAGDRCVTACTCLCPASRISVSHLQLIAFRGTPSADRSGNEALRRHLCVRTLGSTYASMYTETHACPATSGTASGKCATHTCKPMNKANRDVWSSRTSWFCLENHKQRRCRKSLVIQICTLESP